MTSTLVELRVQTSKYKLSRENLSLKTCSSVMALTRHNTADLFAKPRVLVNNWCGNIPGAKMNIKGTLGSDSENIS